MEGTRPSLVIQLGLEESPHVYLDAASYEDEQRLRLWLRNASSLAVMLDVGAWLLDRDEFNEQGEV